ncbi:hypothetical protein TcasGA2_TC032064 [Tribolium castaneum]|uniref:Uncharacterized protein n=1 Tax=Tribolium castaneum TaxID=7070 RepID=A0A139WMP3_TRICA|nr:hypothetical protein TcasGA2_TC032064 [Tribolium castaneum]
MKEPENTFCLFKKLKASILTPLRSSKMKIKMTAATF